MSKKRKSKKTGSKLSSHQLQRELLNLFQRNPKKRLNPKQAARKLKITNSKDSVQAALDKLVEDKKLHPLGDYLYKLRYQEEQSSNGKDATFYEGTVDMTRSGDAYIVCEGLENDVHVSSKYLESAMNGDKVRIRTWTPRGRRKPEGEVVKVLERSREHFLGTLWLYPGHAIVTLDTNPPMDVAVELGNIKEAQDGHRVVVRIEDWEGKGKFKHPQGVVTTVLGLAGSNDIEMKSILINNGFELDFPEEVLIRRFGNHGGRNLKKLAARSTRFANAYCPSPLCGPSRASFMTGCLPSRTGVFDNAAGFPSDMPTFAHHLRGAGYQTTLCGKMHFVGPDQLHGFEERLTTDIYPADYGWTPDYRKPGERIDWWYHNMGSVTGAGVAEITNQLEYDDEVAYNAVRKVYDLARGHDARPWRPLVQ